VPHYSAVDVDRKGPVAELRLSRPDLHNRFDATLLRELGPAWTSWAATRMCGRSS
jgi:enoyl-CoA hydratase/carnithine racemase